MGRQKACCTEAGVVHLFVCNFIPIHGCVTVHLQHYKKLWKVLKETGKKVLFCSDGTWREFVDDIANAGADGFIFEPTTSLDVVVEKYGKTHVIVGSKVDCRTLTFGAKDGIKAEVDATLKLARQCPGFIFAVGNHIPQQCPCG